MEPTREGEPAERSEAPTAGRDAFAAPAGGAGRVLALQRTIGNRAVRKLLRETDPRLTYTPAAVAEGKGLDAQKLPWNSPGNQEAGWNAETILSKLTQVDESGTTFTDEVRCGANAVLAVAITRGPFATEVFARGIMLAALALSENASAAADRRQAPAASSRATATSCSWGPTRSAPGVMSRNLGQVNHFVVLGKDQGGKVFLYDPYPRVGTQFLRSGDANFWTLFETADGRWKASYIFIRP